MVDYSHQMTHAATVLLAFSKPNETSEQLIERVSNDSDTLLEFTKLLSNDYTVYLVKSILSNDEFKRTLKNIRGEQ